MDVDDLSDVITGFGRKELTQNYSEENKLFKISLNAVACDGSYENDMSNHFSKFYNLTPIMRMLLDSLEESFQNPALSVEGFRQTCIKGMRAFFLSHHGLGLLSCLVNRETQRFLLDQAADLKREWRTYFVSPYSPASLFQHLINDYETRQGAVFWAVLPAVDLTVTKVGPRTRLLRLQMHAYRSIQVEFLVERRQEALTLRAQAALAVAQLLQDRGLDRLAGEAPVHVFQDVKDMQRSRVWMDTFFDFLEDDHGTFVTNRLAKNPRFNFNC